MAEVEWPESPVRGGGDRHQDSHSAHLLSPMLNLCIPHDSATPEVIHRIRVGIHRRLRQSENSETYNWLSAAIVIKNKTKHKTENQEQEKGTKELPSH